MITLGAILAVLDDWFPPSTAESWDAVGLVCGDPAEPVGRISLAVDATPATVDEAIQAGAQLLITHHPLLLTGVHGVPTTDPKGALVHRMIRAGLAHYVAHTNADVADPGVSDALAHRLGLTGLVPLEPLPAPALDKLVTFVPTADAERVATALAEAGAGAIGDYDACSFRSDGLGTFRPLPGAHPTIGEVGALTRVAEVRLEVVLPRRLRAAVIAVLRAGHPYEEPAFDVFEQATLDGPLGLGRVGDLATPMTLRDFTRLCAERLPATQPGVRAAGHPDRIVTRVAVCGGSGGSLIETARGAGADVFVTADLKHHAVLDAVTERGGDPMTSLALVDAAHWATESPWLDELAVRLRQHFPADLDTGLKISVSGLVTDPWTLHAPSPESSPSAL